MKFPTEVQAFLDDLPHYQEAVDYYEGEVPETFATAKLRRAFQVTGERSRMNFCRPVVNAVSQRLELASISGTTKAATAKIDEIWQLNNLGLEADDLHRTVCTYGDAYMMAWPDEEGQVLVSVNTPLTTKLFYDPENPRRKSHAIKIWRVDEDSHRMNIYTVDSVKKFVAKVKQVNKNTEWLLISEEDNPFDVIPVFHFRTERPYGRPEHKDAYDCQNAINKLFITNMFTIDYQGAPQRYALSNFDNTSEMRDFQEGDTDRENVGSLQNGPGQLWYLEGVNSVGEFKPADPDVFWGPIKDTVRAMASLTNTPLHYFEKTGNVPSGEALRVAESPLMKKVKTRQESLAPSWRELFLFLLSESGINSDVQVKWHAVESMDSLDQWDVILKKINAGLSHRQALREAGYDEELIQKIMEERREEKAEGSYYQRAPEVRVSTTNNETNEVDE